MSPLGANFYLGDMKTWTHSSGQKKDMAFPYTKYFSRERLVEKLKAGYRASLKAASVWVFLTLKQFRPQRD